MNHNTILGVITLLLVSSLTYAQKITDYSPAGIDLIKATQLWQNSSNAAGIIFDDQASFSTVSVNYEKANGNFKRIQKGEKDQNIGVFAEGTVNLKNTKFWGSFDYRHQNMKDALGNASIGDPFRGMPYYVASLDTSDWRNQFYTLQFKVSQKLFDKLAIGLGGKYEASLTAKQRDPRCEAKQFRLTLTPSFVLNMNESNRIGLSVNYFSIKEESYMSNLNYLVDQIYYELYGLGESIKGLGSGRTTNYTGNNIGGAFQYNYSGAVNMLLEATFDYKVEDVEFSFTTPKLDASVKDRIVKANWAIFKSTDKSLNKITFGYNNRSISGIQTITQRDNTEEQKGWMTLFRSIRSTYDTNSALVDYLWMKKREESFSTSFHANVEYLKQKDEYILPLSLKKYENVRFQLDLQQNLFLGELLSNRLLIGISGYYKKNLSNKYTYGGNTSDSPIVTILEQNDINYLSSDYVGCKAMAKYSQQYKADSNVNLFLQASFKYIKGLDYEYSHRSQVELAFGFNF